MPRVSAATAFDEMGWPDDVRTPYALIEAWLRNTPPDQPAIKRREAEVRFRRIGITFAVCTESGDAERLIPFDPIPRVLAQAEWCNLRRGLEQRACALDAFVHDVYHDREIIRAGRVTERLVLHNSQFRPGMCGMDLPGRMYGRICGIDRVRVGPDDYYVPEDDCRPPPPASTTCWRTAR